MNSSGYLPASQCFMLPYAGVLPQEGEVRPHLNLERGIRLTKMSWLQVAHSGARSPTPVSPSPAVELLTRKGETSPLLCSAQCHDNPWHSLRSPWRTRAGMCGESRRPYELLITSHLEHAGFWTNTWATLRVPMPASVMFSCTLRAQCHTTGSVVKLALDCS